LDHNPQKLPQGFEIEGNELPVADCGQSFHFIQLCHQDKVTRFAWGGNSTLENSLAGQYGHLAQSHNSKAAELLDCAETNRSEGRGAWEDCTGFASGARRRPIAMTSLGRANQKLTWQ
jgi:hypothetical protein